jgi:hypothetical protein
MLLTQLILVGVLTVVAVGQGLSPARGGPPSDKLSARDASVARSYRGLFIAPAETGNAVQVQLAPEVITRNPNPQPRVVCGMVVVPVTPAVDPKMIIPPKNGPKVEYKIRAIEPRICHE